MHIQQNPEIHKEENEKKERKMKEKNHYYNPLIL